MHQISVCSQRTVFCISLLSVMLVYRLVFALGNHKDVDLPVIDERNNSSAFSSYEIINKYPHDTHAFTQGLFFDDGLLYESTGLYGQSSLRKIDIKTGGIVQKLDLPSRFFGEGITIVNDKLIQLTWRSRIGFIYDKYTFELRGKFQYPTEGWGLTHDGKKFIMSDGTDNLYFLDPLTYEETGRIRVVNNRQPVTKLNELEYVYDHIYANVWLTSRIAAVNPQTGRVKEWLDLEDLVEEAGGDNKVKTLNGIAYNAAGDSLFVTGKLWPWVYEIKVRNMQEKAGKEVRSKQ